jgi:hypothetical protein
MVKPKYIACYSGKRENLVYVNCMHSIQSSLERRRAQRFQVVLLVELTEGTAVTRDLSASGAFFETTRTFAVGECLCFSIVLEHVAPGHTVRLRCCGRVVRIEPYSHSIGVAVGITGYRLEAWTARGEEYQGGRKEEHACSLRVFPIKGQSGPH